MYLKLMSCEDAPDHDSRKRFTIYGDVASVDFERVSVMSEEGGSEPQARVTFRDGSVEHYFMSGNAYVMSDDGKTISSFGYAPIPGSPSDTVAEQERVYGKIRPLESSPPGLAPANSLAAVADSGPVTLTTV